MKLTWFVDISTEKESAKKYICCRSILSFVWILFPFGLGKVVYDNEFKTKGNKYKTKDKIEPQHIYHKQPPLSNSDNDAWRLNHIT